jgi:hypothetical protein
MVMLASAQTGAGRDAPFSALALRVFEWCLTFVTPPEGLGLPRDGETIGVEQLDATHGCLPIAISASSSSATTASTSSSPATCS